ncbi:MAG: hypothetical protein JWO03_2008 [Bacteroidetes bacterium]|nr:hypothetical protein [Bacteroidota bacterium]
MNRLFILFLSLTAAISAHGQGYLLPSRPLVDSALAPFFHGVASGDPLSDRVILWTRVTTDSPSVSVDWQIATDTGFIHIINSGSVTTDTSIDNTVKLDATGLTPNSWYYYRFSAYGKYSSLGRTRTAPVGNIDSLRFAVVSCSNIQVGFFNVYHEIANRNDIDAVLHLGDYYYESGARAFGYAGDSMRLHDPSHEAITLADYRMRHSQYKLDPDLRNCHAQYPFITIWDDHETSNDSWHDGANGHNPNTEGDWYTRKDAGKKAYFEWLPIREIAPGNDTIIHRTEHWGNLLDFIMIDTRYEGRDSTLDILIPDTVALLLDTNRQMLGRPQMQWFKGELSNSTAQWKVVGNQVMLAPLTIQEHILNGDQWDGYPAERKRLLDHIMQNNLKDIVFLTGDIHCAWGNDVPHPDSIYDPATGHGSALTEFVTTSVTSTSDEVNAFTAAYVMSLEPHVKYTELHLRGYLLFDVNKQRVQGDFIHVNTVTSQTYTATDDAQWMNVNNERFLRQAPGILGPRPGNPPLTSGATGIRNISKNMIVLGCYPNPAENEVALQYYLSEPSKVEIHITDMSGRVVYNKSTTESQYGLYDTKVYIDNLGAGSYIMSVTASGKTYSKQIVKGK